MKLTVTHFTAISISASRSRNRAKLRSAFPDNADRRRGETFSPRAKTTLRGKSFRRELPRTRRRTRRRELLRRASENLARREARLIASADIGWHSAITRETLPGTSTPLRATRPRHSELLANEHPHQDRARRYLEEDRESRRECSRES